MGGSLPCGRALERAFDHGSNQRAAVGGAGMNIVLRIDGGAGSGFGRGDRGLVDYSSIEHVFDRRQAQRPVGNADPTDMGVACLAVLILVVANGGPRPGQTPPPPAPSPPSP